MNKKRINTASGPVIVLHDDCQNKNFVNNIVKLNNDYIEKQLILFLEKNGYSNLTIEELKKLKEK